MIGSLDVALRQADKVRENRVFRAEMQVLVQKRLGQVALANQPAKRLLQERRGEGLEVSPAAFRCIRTMEDVVAGALRGRAEAERRRWRR